MLLCVYRIRERTGRWPTQALFLFWLEWGISTGGQSLPAAEFCLRPIRSLSLYSERSAGIGSTLAARVAGKALAANATKAIPMIARR